MKISIPLEALAILHTLYTAGYQGYIVGGAVRDLLLAAQLGTIDQGKDYDFTTNATPEQLQALFPESFYENAFGTVSVTPENLREQLQLPEPAASALLETEAVATRIIDLANASKIHSSLQKTSDEVAEEYAESGEKVVTGESQQAQNGAPLDTKKSAPYEITTFRTDGSYTDHRRPETVTWGKSLQEDLDRRDFTINAMAIEVSKEKLREIFSAAADGATNTLKNESITLEATDYTIHDPHHGTADLEKHIIRTVGDPLQRFREDALRMLRAIRFAVQLNMQIEEATYQAIKTEHELLSHISFERIRDEFLKMITSDYPKDAIELLDETGLLYYIIPELLDAKGVEQAGHHTTDVWIHSLDALAATPTKDPVVRLATLLHDIAKPDTFALVNGLPTFYNHEIIGSRIAKKIARRLRLSNAEVDRVFTLVRYHMFHYQPDQTDAALRRFMRKVGLENIDDILDLREGDRLGSGARKTSWRLEEMKQRMIEQLNQPMDVTDLAIDGSDLMKELQLQPGPIIGKILHALFEAVLENPELNTKDHLLDLARKQLIATAQQESAQSDSPQ